MAASANTLDMSTLCWVRVYRNATLHLEVKEGHTAAAHETILATMEGFLHTDPEQLLDCSSQTVVLSQLVTLKLKINWSGYLKWTQPSVLHATCVDQVTRYKHGIDMEAILVCNQSTNQS